MLQFCFVLIKGNQKANHIGDKRCLENPSYKTELRVVTTHIELVTRISYNF